MTLAVLICMQIMVCTNHNLLNLDKSETVKNRLCMVRSEGHEGVCMPWFHSRYGVVVVALAANGACIFISSK